MVEDLEELVSPCYSDWQYSMAIMIVLSWGVMDRPALQCHGDTARHGIGKVDILYFGQGPDKSMDIIGGV